MRPGNWFIFYFIAIGGCLSANRLQAQHLQKPLRVITTKDGLPQSFISGLVQDKDGFVWIGTRNGLARYDGLHFRLFMHHNTDSSTPASNLIISLWPDKHDHIWIEHESSNIDCIDPVTEAIEHVTARPLFRSQPVKFTRKGWIADKDGNLWCIQKSNGLYRYVWKNNKVDHFTARENGIPSDTIRGLLEDRQQYMWIVSERGISRFDPKTGIFRHTPIPYLMDFSFDPRSDVEVIAVHERKNGEIMFGDRNQLFFYNPPSNSFRTVPFAARSQQSVHSLQTGPDGYDYLESGGTVYRYSDKDGLDSIGNIGLVAFPNAKSFLVDRSGLIWLGTDAAGIHQIDLSAPFFESHATEVTFFYHLLRQELGIALDRFSGWPLKGNEFLAASYFVRSAYDPLKRLWLALRDRVGYFDVSAKQFVMLPPVPGIGNREHLTWGIRGISFTPGGVLWVIGDKGYIGFWDDSKHNWVTFLNLSQMKENNPNFTLNDVLADGDKLWITSGSGEGLLCIDIRTKDIKQINRKTYPALLPTDLVLGLQPDPVRDDLLWIGTYEGLVCLDKKNMKSQVFLVDQGLPDNTIYAIQTDKAGYLWLSTNKGLCRFHPVNHDVRIFQTPDGLPGNEFNRFHSMRLPDGRLAFGGTDGWALFDPLMIKPDNYHPPVAFTSLKINNIFVDHLSAKDLLPAPLNRLKTLSLPYDQNTLTFEFAGLEFNQPKKLSYRYKLGRYDENWIVTDNPVINYTKLPPGKYGLSINASNTSGQWSPLTRTLSVVITPPFWLTWWAYCLYILLLTGLIWLYVQYRLNRERMLQKVFLKEREAIQLKTVDELKTRFFSNITHEFRTPLTLILTPAQRLKTSVQQKDQLRWLATIERNALQLLRLINQLLDFSKLESGTLMLHETRGNIRDFVEEVLKSFYEEAATNGISLGLDSHVTGDYWFDTDKLEQVIRNLVANALKFTPKGGNVEVAVDVAPAKAEEKSLPGSSFPIGILLTVKDTGIGIPPDQLPYVFNRFYQVNPISTGRSAASHPKGSGIGLALVKEMVELQGGRIEVDSRDTDSSDWHTTFTTWLPYRRATDMDGPGKELKTEVFSMQYEPFIPSLPATGENRLESNGTNILLVEDNTELAEFIAESLPGAYNITRSVNGAEGLDKAFSLLPDLVITDVMMPVMNGFDFCRRLKKDGRTDHIPVIMLTAKSTFDNRIEGLSLGADDYLTKPFHIRELQLRVHNLLQRQRIMRDKLHLELSQPDPELSRPVVNAPLLPQDAFMQKLYDIIEEKLDDTLFGVEELAAGIGMSRTTLYRKLKVISDLPAGDIIRNYRLKRATRFLKEGSNSSETAYLVGFDSPAYFTKCFREFYQLTPLEYIQKNR